jgi:hypothetical protein
MRDRQSLLDTLRDLRQCLPPSAAFSHQTAAALLGFGVVPSAAVHITVPPGVAVARRRGLTTHRSALPLPLDGVVDAYGLPCLSPARSAVDLARTLPRPEALAGLDAALRVGACTPAELAAELRRQDRLRGVRQARELVRLADRRARSRPASHMRLLLLDAGLPAPRPQLAVTDEKGVERCRLELGYEQERVGIEHDRVPADGLRARAARRRRRWLAAAGWRLRLFTDDDLYRRPEALVQMVRATLLQPGATG